MNTLRLRIALLGIGLVGLFTLGIVVADARADGRSADTAGHTAGHGRAQGDEGAGDHHGHGAQHHTPLPLAELTSDSVYHLDATWTDQHGAHVRLADFAGQSVIGTMFYGNCTTACPLLLHRARTLQHELGVPMPVLAVSFDPDTDTPEAMHTYAEQRGYAEGTLGAWSFLSAPPSVIRTLATMLGVQYQRRGDGHFDHSNLIAVLDAQGVVRVRTEGTSPDVSRVVEEVRAAGLVRP